MKNILCVTLYWLMSAWSWLAIRRLAKLGNAVHIGRCPFRGCLRPPYTIGAGVTIGAFTTVEACAHIGDHVRIGDHCRILGSAIIGCHAAVDSYSTVDGFVPDHAIATGSPCQIVGFAQPAHPPAVTDPVLHGREALHVLVEHFSFDTVLDIGSGAGVHSQYFVDNGKSVTCIDIATPEGAGSKPSLRFIQGNYLECHFDRPFDCIWACHVLEHQPNPNLFLAKIHDDLAENGVLAITIPPLKHGVVGGHVTLWNAGILLYQLILAGFDCSEAAVLSSGYNISVVVRKKKAVLPQLTYDKGDIERLGPFFPFDAREGFDGRILRCRWPKHGDNKP